MNKTPSCIEAVGHSGDAACFAQETAILIQDVLIGSGWLPAASGCVGSSQSLPTSTSLRANANPESVHHGHGGDVLRPSLPFMETDGIPAHHSTRGTVGIGQKPNEDVSRRHDGETPIQHQGRVDIPQTQFALSAADILKMQRQRRLSVNPFLYGSSMTTPTLPSLELPQASVNASGSPSRPSNAFRAPSPSTLEEEHEASVEFWSSDGEPRHASQP